MEGLIFGGEICVAKSAGRQLRKKVRCCRTDFACFTLYLRAMSKNKPPGVYNRRGDLTEGFFCVTSLGGSYMEGLFSEFYSNILAMA